MDISGCDSSLLQPNSGDTYHDYDALFNDFTWVSDVICNIDTYVGDYSDTTKLATRGVIHNNYQFTFEIPIGITISPPAGFQADQTITISHDASAVYF